ncbi:MAG: hypothetical protein JWP59_4508, partial [Massilia sp.]|nr:hypothetical protein [Massilia sp.]
GAAARRLRPRRHATRRALAACKNVRNEPAMVSCVAEFKERL